MVEGRTSKDIPSSTSLAAVTVNLRDGSVEEVKSPAKSPHPVISAGSSFSHYKIIRKIAHGAMGVVYLARDEKLLRDVALKVILTMPGMIPSDDQTIRFMREAQSVAKLRHPNIVPVFEVDAYEGCQFFAMEYIEGPTLEEFIIKEEITASKAVEIIHGILDGLKEAHSKNIVHRDIKPANIIMANNKDPMIMDFGLAKLLENDERLTMTGSMLGTPCFMSPEQASGDPSIDQRSDIFSVGVLLYEMVTGSLPFKGNSYMKTILLVIEGKYARPRMLKRKLSKDVANIIKKSLEKEKEDRYRSAEDMLDDCERFMRGEVVTISKSGIYRKCSRQIWRNKTSIILSFLTLLIIGYLIHIKEHDRQESQKEIDDVRRKAQMQASEVLKDKDKIIEQNMKLAMRGEKDKLGTTSPQFSEFFDNPKTIEKRWETYGAKLKIKKDKLVYLPAKQDFFVHPKELSFSSVFKLSVDVKLEKDNRFGIYFGSVKGKANEIINDPVLLVYEIEEEIEDYGGLEEWERYLKISFYKQTKSFFDRKSYKKIKAMSFTLPKLVALKNNTPIAIRRFKLPSDNNEMVSLKIKKNESDVELLIDMGAYQKKFRVSNDSFLTSKGLSCGMIVFKENVSEIPVDRFSIDKWIPGGDNSEVGRLLDLSWDDDYQKIFSRFHKYYDRLQQSLTYATTEDEKVSFEYQMAKVLFLMGVSAEKRNGRYKKDKLNVEVLKMFERSYQITKDYFMLGRKENTTEFSNYQNLYLSNLYHLANYHLANGDFKKAKEFISEYQEQTNFSTPFYDWYWLMPVKINKTFVATQKPAVELKQLSNIHSVLNLFTFPVRGENRVYFHDYLNELTRSALQNKDFELMKKFHDLNNDDSSLNDLQKFISDNIGAKKDGEAFVQALVSGRKIYNIPEISILNNDEFYYWRVKSVDGHQIKKVNHYLKEKLSEPSVQSFFELLPELEKYLDPKFNFTLDTLNQINKNSFVRKKILALYQDEFLYANDKTIKAVGEVFSVELKIGADQYGTVRMAFNNDGLKIRLIAKTKKESEKHLWKLFFDFRQGKQFLSPKNGKGRFEISYNPKGKNKKLEITTRLNGQLKIEEIEVEVANYRLIEHEIRFVIPHREVFKLIGSDTIRYFAFNASLSLVHDAKFDLNSLSGEKSIGNIINIEKSDFKNLFVADKRILKYENGPFHKVVLPLFADRNFRLGVKEKTLGDEVEDKILFHHLLCQLFKLKYIRPIATPKMVDDAMVDFVNRTMTYSKVFKKSHTFKNMQLFFELNEVYSVNRKFKKQILLAGLEKLRLRIKKISSNRPKNKNEESLFDQVKTFRSYLFLDLKNQDLISQYYQWFDDWVRVTNAKNKPMAEEISKYFIELPDTKFNLREKAILYKNAEDVLQFHKNLNKFIKTPSIRMTPDLLFEHCVSREFSKKTFMFEGVSPSLLGQINDRLGSNQRNLKSDLFKVLSGLMTTEEFDSKYLKRTGYHDLKDAFLLERNESEDVAKMISHYKKASVYFGKVVWLKSIINNRMMQLKEN